MILNLGCGAKTSPHCINIDRNIHLRIARNPILYRLALMTFSESRVRHLRNLKQNIQLHDLRLGIPYPDDSADAVYHSHVLEHIDRDFDNPSKDHVMGFLKESRRVLKPGGILRIVVPDLELSARTYIAALDGVRAGHRDLADVNNAVYTILGQAVRKEADGTSRQKPFMRWLENLVLGDARKRGETHQWEYDDVSLGGLLLQAGFSQVNRADYNTSGIAEWNTIGLDQRDGQEYKPGSLYMEAVK